MNIVTAIVFAGLMLATGISQANQKYCHPEHYHHHSGEWIALSAIKNAVDYAIPAKSPIPNTGLKPLIKKPKPLRSNPTRYILVNIEDNDDGYYIDDEGLYVGYRRPELVKNNDIVDNNYDELSEHIKFRLFLARQLALMKAQGYNLRT